MDKKADNSVGYSKGCIADITGRKKEKHNLKAVTHLHLG